MMDLPDHRRLGRQLEIFSTEPECGAGLPFWLPAGAIVRDALLRFVMDLECRHGYRHVSTPVMAKRELYERSGHWAHYQDDMYPPMRIGAEQLVLRPMLCPHHILIYDQRPRGVQELPLRIAEAGAMFRNAYAALHIPAPKARLSRRGDGPKFVDEPAVWNRSETMIRRALDRDGVAYVEAEGEAAFYGPKIDLQVTDPQGRDETLSTIQIDLVLPQRFGLSINHEASRPLMIHRSVIGTLERMTAHLLEVHNGALPPWLSPVQVLVLPAHDEARAYAATVDQQLGMHGLRSEVDQRDATLGARIRNAQERKVPCVAVVGRRETDDHTVAVRLRTGRQLDPMPVSALIRLLTSAIDGHAIDLVQS